MVLNLFFISLALALSAQGSAATHVTQSGRQFLSPKTKLMWFWAQTRTWLSPYCAVQLVLSADLTEIYSLQQTPYFDKIYCVAPYPMELDLRKHEKRRKNILGYLDKPMSALQSHSVKFTLPNININTKLFDYKRQTTTTTLILGNTSNQLFETWLLKHV